MTAGLPLRILGGHRSGKTTRLRQWAERFDNPLVLCATQAAADAFGHPNATTFWGLAARVLGRPVRVLSSAEVAARIGDPHLADAVCHYQASFLGREELRTHADAAGVYEQWEHVADTTERWTASLDGEADWAGVLVEASLLLRDPERLAHERSQFDAVVVDDFEAASFAVNRLLMQLAGFGGAVVVAGNPANAVWRHVAGSPASLDRFPKRFGCADDVVLGEAFAVEGEGTARLLVGPGGDPWLPLPDGPVPVALSTSLAWAEVELALVDDAAVSPFDHHVLAGPDVPDDAERAERRRREARAREALARSRGRVR